MIAVSVNSLLVYLQFFVIRNMLFVTKSSRRSMASLGLQDESLKRLRAGGHSLPRLKSAIPKAEDLAKWQSVYRPNRRMARETPSPQPHSSSPVPLISLAKVRAGVRPDKPWFPDMPSLALSHSYDHSHHLSDSFSRLFPTASFERLAPSTDTNEYAASARTAFQSGYLKQRRIRLRPAEPREHPEYSESGQFAKRRDRVVRYRESMLRLRTLVSGRQLLS